MTLLNNIKNFVKRNDTKILTGIAIVGAVTAPILASRATLKAKKKVDEYTAAETTTQNPSLATKARLTAHYYIPTVAVVGVSIYCMVKCEKIHISRELEILGISAFWEKRYRLLNDKVTEKLGPEAVRDLKKDISAEQATYEEHYKKTGETSITDENGKEKAVRVSRNNPFLVYDEICGDYNYVTFNDISAACYLLNKRFMGMGYYGCVSWNEVRRALGWPSNPIAKQWGWDGDNDEDLIETMMYNGDTWLDICVGTKEGIDPYRHKDGTIEEARSIYVNYGPQLLGNNTF